MNRNSENHFATAPSVEMPRSTFRMHQNIRTTFNAGQLIPFYVDADILPGDTFKMKGTFVVRQSTPIYPTMDNSYLDVYFFFIPHRICWEHWKEFMGENTTGAWTQTTQYAVPKIRFGYIDGAPRNCKKGDIADYFGIPLTNFTSSDVGKEIRVNRLPFTAYIKIYNEWFRAQNLAAPAYEPINDNNTWTLGDNEMVRTDWFYSTINTEPRIMFKPAPVNKFADYFTTANPAPQKGGAVALPLGSYAPVKASSTSGFNSGNSNALTWTDLATGNQIVPLGNDVLSLAITNTTGNTVLGSQQAGAAQAVATPRNLIADLSNAVAATVNAMRLSVATQRILERDVYGTRIREVIRNHFQTIMPDARAQIPEYLGGSRIPITMNQVAQTSSTDSTSPQGNVSAYSLTIDSKDLFTKSFTEWGTIMGVLCVRQEHSYDQGLARQWSRTLRLDYYWPELAHLGEQAILNKEIYADGSSNDDGVFAYGERWSEYKYKINLNTGAFRTQYAASLDTWHYGDSYAALPVLSAQWSAETKDYIDRTLAVNSTVEDQYLMDSRIDIVATRPIPLYSVPGLMDHY